MNLGGTALWAGVACRLMKKTRPTKPGTLCGPSAVAALPAKATRVALVVLRMETVEQETSWHSFLEQSKLYYDLRFKFTVEQL